MYRRLDDAQVIVDKLRPFPLPRTIDSAQKGGTNVRRKCTATYCSHIQSNNPITRVRSLLAGNTGTTWCPTGHVSMSVLQELGSNAQALYDERVIRHAG
jgi:hypothetical protein